MPEPFGLKRQLGSAGDATPQVVWCDIPQISAAAAAQSPTPAPSRHLPVSTACCSKAKSSPESADEPPLI